MSKNLKGIVFFGVFISIIFFMIEPCPAQVSFDRKTVDGNFAAYFNLAFDLDKDGDNDILSGHSDLAWWQNDGSGHFTKKFIDGSVAALWSIFPVDVDGDGDNDLLIAESGNNDIAWYKNNGGSFSRIVIEPDYINAESVAGADFDKDGDVDVVGLTYGTDTSYGVVSLWENDGRENFHRSDLDTDFEHGHKLNVADLDHDGDMDVVAVKASANGLVWYQNNGNLNFSKRIISSRSGLGFYVVDMDKDGTLDIIFCDHGNGEIVLFYNNGGASSFSSKTIASGLSWPSFAAPGDFNQDGRLDVVVVNRDSDDLVWLENQGSNQFETHPLDTDVTGPFTCDAADFDGDGVPDVVSGSKDDTNLLWWHTNSGSSSNPSITVTRPNGGESFTANNNEDIRWSSNGDFTTVRIEYTTNNGSSWQMIASSTSNDGSYTWQVPSLDSDQCKIRISESESGSPSDMSDQVFSIHKPAPITVTTPNGGESWAANGQQTIEWDSDHSFDTVKIELTLDSGTSWSVIADNEANDGSYVWNIPNYSSENCLIRISDANNSSVSDVSNSEFSILDFSGNMIVRINCDDAYKLYVNGEFIGEDDQWDVAQEYMVPIRDGKNVLAVYGKNRSNAKGLIAEVEVDGAIVLQTDTGWRHNASEQIGWTDIDFNDSGWDHVTDLGQYGVEPWYKNIANFPENSTAHWIWGSETIEYFRGSFTADLPPEAYSVSGQCLYFNNNNPIANATVTMTGDFSATGVTASDGSFTFGSITANSNIAMSAAKTSQEDVGPTTILSYDAALASRFAVDLINLSDYQQIAADVDRNGEVTSYDAAAISRFAVALSPLDGTYVADWDFRPETQQINSINSDVTDVRFDGILLGDVKGGWNGNQLAKSATFNKIGMEKFLQNQVVLSGDTTKILFDLPGNRNVISFDLWISYPEIDYRYLAGVVIPDGSGMNTIVNATSGKLKLGAYSLQFLTRDYQVEISFLRKNSQTNNPIKIEKFVINNEVVMQNVDVISAVNQAEQRLPNVFALQQNYPNPFNSETVIRYSLPENGTVDLKIYNIKGELVKVLKTGSQTAGNYSLVWRGVDQFDEPVPTGIYLVQLAFRKKMVQTIKIGFIK